MRIRSGLQNPGGAQMKITDQEDAFGYVIYWICLQRKFKRKVGEEKPKRVNVQRRSYCPETLQIVINRK